MSSPSKNRRVIAYPSKNGSDLISLYQCGDCQRFFPSLQTIHGHFKCCVTNSPLCRNEYRQVESPCELTVKPSGTSFRKTLLEGTVSQDDYENIMEIAVSSDTPGLSVSSLCNSESKLENKNAGMPSLDTMPDGTLMGQSGNRTRKHFDEQGQSGNRKQKHFEEQRQSGSRKQKIFDEHVQSENRKRKHFNKHSFSTGISQHVSFAMVNDYRLVKRPKLDTKEIENEDSIHMMSDTRDSDVEEDAAIICPLEEVVLMNSQIASQIACNNSHILDLPVRQSNIENDNGNQSIDVEYLDEKNEKIADKNDKPIKLVDSTNSASTEDTNTSVTDLMTVSPLTPNRNISDCNEKGLERNNAGIVNIVNEVLDPSNSVLYIKCEETGSCIASVDISSTNSELDCIEVKEELVSEGSVVTFLEKVKQEVNTKTEQQPFRNQTKTGINEKSINKNDLVSQNRQQVLITYNEKENTDLNLECEDNVTSVENDLLPVTPGVSDGQDILEDHTRIKSVKMGNKLDLRKRNRSPHDKDISNKFQYKLKRLSVIIKRLDMASVMKQNTEESPDTTENEFGFSEDTDQFNKCVDSGEQNESCNGVSRNVTTNNEAMTQPIANDHRNNKRKCRGVEIHSDSFSEENPGELTKEKTFQEDTESCKHLSNKVNIEGDISMASCSEEGSNGDTEHTNDSVADGVVDDNSSAEDCKSDKICKFCKKCNTHFTKLGCYINHLILFHHPAYTRKDLTWCPFCTQKVYSSYFNSKLKRHVSCAHKLDEMKCLRCELKFDTYIELHKHVTVCRARISRRSLKQTRSNTETVQCRICKTFHVYRPSESSGEVLKDIIQTLPDDEEVNALKEKNETLQGNLVHHDKFHCKLCNIVFEHLTCALNHAVIAHMKDTMKTKCSLFRKSINKSVCLSCNKIHNITFVSVKEMRRLLLQCENSKSSSEKFSSNDKKVLSMIRGGLFKYFGYKYLKPDLNKSMDNQLCKECNILVGPFLCRLHHMIVKHFSRASIDEAMKSCFFNRKNVKCGNSYCDKRHVFAVCNIRRFKHCLAFEFDDITGHEDESLEKKQLTPACDESSIVKKLREILVSEAPETSSGYGLKKMSVNVIAAKTKEEVAEDMEYRVGNINGNFVCRLCLSEYKNYSCCKSHVLTEHAVFFSYRIGSEVFTCPNCMMHFHTLYLLDVHLEQNHSIYKFTCTKCEKRFNTYNEYSIHIKHGKPYIQTHFNEELSCKECRLIHSCTVQNGEEKLIISVSHENETVFKNVRTDPTKHVNDIQCGSDVADHSEHEKGSYSDVAFDGQQFVCLVCLEKFEELTCCFTHAVMQHYKRAELICSICQKPLHRKAGHIAHLKDVHGLEAHYCRHCYTGFEDIVSRDNHAEHCQSRTNKISDKVTDNVCNKCYSVHLHMSDSDIKSSCNECELGFASIECAKNHFYHKHFPTWVILASSENVFRCPCGKEVLRKSELILHLKNEHSSEQDKTDQDKTVQSENHEKSQNFDYDSYFKRKENLNNKCVECEHVHIIASNTGHVKQRKQTKCRICQGTFSRPKCLQNHILTAHTGIFQPRQCVGCGLHFVGSLLLELHQNKDRILNEGNVQDNEMAVHKSCRRNASLVKCDECEEIHQHQFSTEETKLKKAKSPKAIREERNKIKNSHRKVHKCCTCGLAFSNHEDLMVHRRSVHGKIKDKKGAVCGVCNKEIDKNLYYSEHLKKVHCSFEFTEGELFDDFKRNFSCVYCEKTFSFYMDVQMHLRSKHFEKQLAARKHYRPQLEGTLIKGPRILQCPVCFKICESVSSGDHCHIDSHFNEVLGKEKSKEYVCDICGKGYTSKWQLEEHKNVHSGIRKYKCDVCGKSFIYWFNLQTHALVHKEKKEKCSVCGMKFTLPHHVRAHIKRKHPDHV